MFNDWEERNSDKKECRHCKKFTKINQSDHFEKYDPNLKSWVSICKRCGMVEKV
jgi:hypothetical protein